MQIDRQIADVQQVVEEVLTLARQKGATQAEASMSKVEGISVSARLGEVENVEFTNDGGLGITVYVGKRKGSASTADLSQQALLLAVEKALHIAKFTSEDDCAGLADAELMATHFPDLGLYFPQPLDTEQALQLALATEAAALESDKRITNSEGATYNANLGMRVYGNSHGINAGFPSSRYSLSCMVIAGSGDKMQRDYAYSLNRDPRLLLPAATIGQQAASATLARLGARKLPTCKVPVLFHKELAAGFFGHYVAAISGGNLYRRSSFLLDKLGTQVFPSWCQINERPHLKGALASANFDSEGVATRDHVIVQDGLLSTYLYTSYSARKLNTQTNGHAGGIFNWLIANTGETEEELLQKMGRGLYVTELMGQGVNTVNGDYSRGAAGFWVENGKIQYPVHEVTIASNLSDMYANIVAIGSETEVRGSIQCGAVLLAEMKVAGN